MINRRWSHLLHALVLAVIGGWVCERSGAAQGLPIDGVEVQECLVRFANEVDVPALESGQVVEVHVKQNQQVRKGEPIARLDGRTLVARRQAAATRLEAARTEALSDVELRYAETALTEAKAELKLNENIESGTPRAVARQRMTTLRLAVERGELEIARAEKRMKKSLVDAKMQQTEVALLDEQLRNLHNNSPIAGIVLDVGRSAGEWIEKGQPLATIAQIDRMHVHALVNSKQISPTVCPNLPVMVFWNDPATGVQRRLHGRVLSVDPQQLPGGLFRLHAEIVNRTEKTTVQKRMQSTVQKNESGNVHWQLTPGASVRMVVQTADTVARLAIPSAKR